MRAKDREYDTPLPVGSHVAVIGAGNTAMDAMRVCERLGAEEVHCIYRRSRAEAPARVEEVHHAEEEGIEFHWLTAPVEILDDGKGGVRGSRCIRMELGEPNFPVAAAGAGCGKRIRVSVRPRRGRDRHQRQSDYRADFQDQTKQARLYRHRRNPRDLADGKSTPAETSSPVRATVIEAMGAGRRAARSMKAYLGIRDSDVVYRTEPVAGASKLLGMEIAERNFVRIRTAREGTAAAQARAPMEATP